LLHPDRALDAILKHASPLGNERVSLEDAYGRALPLPLPCLVDQPPFDKAKMDGFAYRRPSYGEADAAYRVTAAIAAGGSPGPALREGECARIMTGAPIPPGADAVQRFEYAEEGPDGVRFVREEEEDNIIRRAEHFRAGEIVMLPRLLGAADLGVLAACGYGSLEVSRVPRVAVLSTGAELRAPGTELAPGQIHDSNGILLRSLVRTERCVPIDAGRIRDEEAALADAADRALADADVLLVSGGVSMGDFDCVPSACARIGAETIFHTAALKPGKPLYAARRGKRFILGCPGNPLSTFVVFELFAKPLLNALRGLAHAPSVVACKLDGSLKRTTADRVEYVPVAVRCGACAPVRCDGSSMVTALAETDGLVRLDLGSADLREGSIIDVRLVR